MNKPSLTPIGETYAGRPQSALLAGFIASVATFALFVAFAVVALPSAAFA